MKFRYIGKFVNNKEYKDYYEKHFSYTVLKKVKGGYIVGFISAQDSLPVDCLELNKYEQDEIAEKRKKANIYPC